MLQPNQCHIDLKSILEDTFKKADEGKIFVLGLTRFYLFEMEYYTSALTIAKDHFKEVVFEKEFFCGIFYFPEPTPTKIYYKDIHLLRCSEADLYNQIEVLTNFAKELEKNENKN